MYDKEYVTVVGFTFRHMGLSGNRLLDNAVSQLTVWQSRYVSDANCFEIGGAGQSVAELTHAKSYRTLTDYQKAANQDCGSRDACTPSPEPIDVEELHASTLSYLERARRILAEGRPRETAPGR